MDNCEVTEIDFSKGGYLGHHHINPAPIDAEGIANVEDDLGRYFTVHVDKTDDNDSEDDDHDDDRENDGDFDD
jgi:hypothetical protein